MNGAQCAWYQIQISIDEKENYELLREIAEHNAMFTNSEGVQQVRDARKNTYTSSPEDFEKNVEELFGRKIGEVCDLAIITSKDRFEELKRGAVESGMKEKNIIFCDNSKDIYSIVTLFCKSGDAVLLEGRVPAELVKLL